MQTARAALGCFGGPQLKRCHDEWAMRGLQEFFKERCGNLQNTCLAALHEARSRALAALQKATPLSFVDQLGKLPDAGKNSKVMGAYCDCGHFYPPAEILKFGGVRKSTRVCNRMLSSISTSISGGISRDGSRLRVFERYSRRGFVMHFKWYFKMYFKN